MTKPVKRIVQLFKRCRYNQQNARKLSCLPSLLSALLLGICLFNLSCSRTGDATPPSQTKSSGKSSQPTQSVNYAQNGHAEKGMKYWGFHGTAHVSVSDTTAHSGMYSIYVGNRTDTWHGATHRFENVKPNKPYQIAAWVKLAPGEPDSEVIITARFQGEEPIYRNLVSATVSSREWTQIKGNFDHPNTLLDYIYIESPNPTLSYYIDDVSLIGESEQQVTDGSSFQNGKAHFNWFEYSGGDAIFNKPIPEGHFQNPILSGFRSEPSITRVGDDYYMVHSSYVYWPGIPIYHSRDLVNWRQIGHVLTHQNNFDLDDRQVTEGITSPTIRYHNGTYYVIAAALWSGGHFMVTAEDPTGPWSSPVFLKSLRGIDPDIFFDDDGKVYITHNDIPKETPHYSGHRAIWLHEYDLKKHSIKPNSSRVLVNGGVEITEKPVWIQGPHLFKKDGWYYLTCAEGGNGFAHAQVIFRARSLNDPFEPGPINPILTQVDLPLERPDSIIAAGHADFVETQNGEWWAVFMASRVYDHTFQSVGREAYLLPITWRDGWPVILERGTPVPYHVKRPNGLMDKASDNPTITGNFTWRDDFDSSRMDLEWQSLREPAITWATLDSINGNLILTAQKDSLSTIGSPAFLSRRLQHHTYTASTELQLPLEDGISAGLVAFQNSRYHYFLGLRKTSSGYSAFLEKASGGAPEVIQTLTFESNAKSIIIGVEGSNRDMAFYYQLPNGQRQYIQKQANAKILSSSFSGEEVGTRLGVYVRGN